MGSLQRLSRHLPVSTIARCFQIQVLYWWELFQGC